MLTSITGINWGDEGKGRMVDLLSQDYDIVARYQGGDNAGHTVMTERGKFVLNLIPSGVLRPDVVCVMGGGMVIDPEHLEKEIASLTEKGVEISPKNLKISDRATITMPFHVAQDGLEEERLSKTGAQFRLHQARHRLQLRRQVHEKDPAHGRPRPHGRQCQEASGDHRRVQEPDHGEDLRPEARQR